MAANGTFSKSWKWESGLFGPVNGFTARFLHGSKRLTIGYENETTAGNSLKNGRNNHTVVTRAVH